MTTRQAKNVLDVPFPVSGLGRLKDIAAVSRSLLFGTFGQVN